MTQSRNPWSLLQHISAVVPAGTTARQSLQDVLLDIALLLSPRPTHPVDIARAVRLDIDLAILALGGELFVKGRVEDPYDRIAKLLWCGPGGVRIDIWADRSLLTSQVEASSSSVPGRARIFLASAKVPDDGLGLCQQRFDVIFKSGMQQQIAAPAPSFEPRSMRDSILSGLGDQPVENAVIARHLSGVISGLQAQCLAGPRIARVVEIGEAPSKLRFSIVMPCYLVLDFYRYQFSAMSLDPDRDHIEWIIVLDSPEQEVEAEERLRTFHELYGGHIRLVIHHKNLGYAPAINTGVAYARAETVVLFNSDVVPDRSGWLSEMYDRLSSDPKIAAVGPLLKFFDGSVQHAGLGFRRNLRGGYFNVHPGKGYPVGHEGIQAARKVPGLTGACIMLRKQTFEDVGGISEDYIVGDFEDSDFCLRIQETCGDLWYVPTAQLFHYERQSIAKHPTYTRTRASDYNRWLHETRWRESLDRLQQA
jgi:GT2 family glycosyltransferase